MYEYKAELIKVVDGDTVDLKVDLGHSTFTEQRYRLYRINAPESRGPERPQGLEATEHLKFLIGKAENSGYPLVIKTHQDKKGKFGRYLCDLYGFIEPEGEEVCLNDQMVFDGHAEYKEY